LEVGAGVEVQEVTEAARPVPETVQSMEPDGATEPEVPVTVAVKTIFEPMIPVPVPVIATVGVA
jgi:hypothetical protein